MADFNIPLDISSLKIIEQTPDTQGNYILTVESTKTESTCHKYGKSATKRYGYASPITVRHLPVLDTPVFLKSSRYDNKTVTTEQYDWCGRDSKTTKPLDDYLTRCMINSTCSDAAKKARISYKTVVRALTSQVNKSIDWNKYTDLTTLGIDEISDKKGHKDFLTIVNTRSKTGEISVLAVLADRQKETVKSFLESIPTELKKTVKTVCTDIYDGFVYAATEVFGQQAVVIDRYHVAKLYRKPLDTLRIQGMKCLKKELSTEEYSELEGVMWIIRQNHECLTKQDKEKLELLYQYSPTLKKAHSYALKLTQIFNSHSCRKLAYSKLRRWIMSVEKSELGCFNFFIVTLNKYHTGIANYFKQRKSSGFIENFNNKIKVIKRRCYGFFKDCSFWDMRSFMGATRKGEEPFERSLIREQQLEGIALAKKKGVYKGRKQSLSTIQIQALYQRLQNGEQKTSLAKELKISRQTLYQYLKAATNTIIPETITDHSLNSPAQPAVIYANTTAHPEPKTQE